MQSDYIGILVYTNKMKQLDKHIRDSTFLELYLANLKSIIEQITTAYSSAGISYRTQATFDFTKDALVIGVWDKQSNEQIAEYDSILEVLVFYAEAFRSSSHPLTDYSKSRSEYYISIGSIQPEDTTNMVYTRSDIQELTLRGDIMTILLGGGTFLIENTLYKYSPELDEPRESYGVCTGPLGYLTDVLYSMIKENSKATIRVSSYAYSLLEAKQIERRV